MTTPTQQQPSITANNFNSNPSTPSSQTSYPAEKTITGIITQLAANEVPFRLNYKPTPGGLQFKLNIRS